MAPTPTPLTFQERIDALQVDMASVCRAFTHGGAAELSDLETELERVASGVSDLAGLVGVLSDLIGNRTATERVQAVEAAHAKERFARLALAAVAEESPCTFPKAWSGHGNINEAVEPEDVPAAYVAGLVARIERQQARREAQS